MKNRAVPAISEKQCMETGIIVTIILIIAGLYTNKQGFYISSLCAGVISILVPIVVQPFAVLWFGLSKKMGAITSWLLLGLIFFFVVTPVGVVRRLSGKDRLNLKNFKKGNGSVFTERQHQYDLSDMEHLY